MLSYGFEDWAPAKPMLISAPAGITQTADCLVVVTPDGRHAYKTSTGSGTITCDAVQGRSGQLTLAQGIAETAGADPNDAAINADGRSLAILHTGSQSISGFAIAADGSPEPFNTRPRVFTTADQCVAPELAHHLAPLQAVLQDRVVAKARTNLSPPRVARARDVLPNVSIPLTCTSPLGRGRVKTRSRADRAQRRRAGSLQDRRSRPRQGSRDPRNYAAAEFSHSLGRWLTEP